MLDIVLTFESGKQQVMRAQSPVMIGRAAPCELRISSWRVSKHHARLSGVGQALELEDMGSLMGTWVNGRRVTVHRPVLPDDDIIIGPCRIRIQPASQQNLDGKGLSSPSQSSVSDAQREAQGSRASPYPIVVGSRTRDECVDKPVSSGEQGGCFTSCPTRKSAPALLINADPTHPPTVAESGSDRAKLLDSLTYRRRLHAGLCKALDLRRRDVAGMSDAALRSEARTLLDRIAAEDTEIPEHLDRATLCREVLDEAVGLGPLEPLLADTSISEIMVNRYDEIYIERDGRLTRHDATFSSEQSVRWVLERIVAPLGRRIDESSPMVDARLPDGSRVNAVIPPIALKGANITIRKFPAQRPEMGDLIQNGSISVPMAEFLLLCVRTRKNVVVSGGTGSGKTTLLNVLSNGIPNGERVVTIEDAAELRINHDNWIALESRPDNVENRGRIDIRDLVRNALRMRPDRIVVGECRGAEAFDMLAAMNTGHEGSLTTLHANSPRDALSRLEAMVLMAGMDLPLSVVREHISASVDIVVQQARLADGLRVVQSITEITGLESGRIQLQELFRHQAGSGFRACGLLPRFIEDWRNAGVAFDIAAFSPIAAVSSQSESSVP